MTFIMVTVTLLTREDVFNEEMVSFIVGRLWVSSVKLKQSGVFHVLPHVLHGNGEWKDWYR